MKCSSTVLKTRNNFGQNKPKNSMVQKPQNILSEGEHDYPVWFADGELNACYIAVDKHVEDGYGDQIAYIYDSRLQTPFRKSPSKNCKKMSRNLPEVYNLWVLKKETLLLFICP
jgi:propionyl-CoA synthetase